MRPNRKAACLAHNVRLPPGSAHRALIRAAFPTSHFADHDGLPSQSSSFVIIPILAQHGEQAAPDSLAGHDRARGAVRAEVRSFGVREYLLLPASAPAEPAPNM